MDLVPFQFTQIFANLYIYHGAVNTGILIKGDRAILIDCDDTLTPSRLVELGISTVERIYCTQHRRPNTAGIKSFDAEVFAPLNERSQFEKAAEYWQDWHNRWHLYHFRPGLLAPLYDIHIKGTVSEGNSIQWGDFTIRVLDTPGMTDGAISYLIELNKGQNNANCVIFCGDTLYAAGQVWDVYSLQKNFGTFSDYHGFLGATKTLINSLRKLGKTNASYLIPSHGRIICSPIDATQMTIQRLEQLYRNYASITALNFYFPHLFNDMSNDPWRMAPSQVIDLPEFIQPIEATSFSIQSESGAIFLIDCGSDMVMETLNTWKERAIYTQIEGCWVTHYHDDHVDALHHLATSTNAPFYADEHIAEILSHPARFMLPCISPATSPITHVTTHGETWHWHEFELTALHFPGQTLYHGGLLLSGRGLKVLFCGDSFAPTGLDDYTAGNRNFIGPGMGYHRCIEIIRQYHPDLILNQHQRNGFFFTDDQLDYMERMLSARAEMLAELLPWDHLNYGIDEGWIRAYPYETETCPGATCIIEIRATNHTSKSLDLTVHAVLPQTWETPNQPVLTSTNVYIGGEWIVSARVPITIPSDIMRGTYPIAFRITLGERYLGQICHALIRV